MRTAQAFFRSAATVAAIAVVVTMQGRSAEAAAQGDTFAWPASLAPFGDGYPSAGNTCRRLGESSATSPYLDHTATLVGCPGDRASVGAQAIIRDRRGRVVGEMDGVTLISVPNEADRLGGTTQRTGPGREHADASSGPPGTLRCARRVGQRMRLCRFDATHYADRTMVVVVYLPGGGTRAIFFGADRSVVGVARKAGDQPTGEKTLIGKRAGISEISVGHERYEIPDAVVSGE